MNSIIKKSLTYLLKFNPSITEFIQSLVCVRCTVYDVQSDTDAAQCTQRTTQTPFLAHISLNALRQTVCSSI